ncbi:conserved hypothetical protein [Burkholderia mallei PRL-20]|uniref:Uncharacterized protein n=1 Tax=Burkholderia mallei (strain NCTC 10229) TaxID=412022 RepID=A2RWR2_BURM9|nr:hypothetical protein BMASAVP1_0119 [Burkholderia mallei SAVP1]ABM98543.1 hypothetical protein BMA10229_0307 [Burkholderia mallei NCTC 10229]ABN87327.1 hypothetical protein BURPS668_A1792 [Burkholderia pseudomallei 668]ABO03563.1 hypothetical protein BMA10247_A1288 [Burkholderia mallei NCTC 10247]EEH25993.1 conserved hypothetical protein [Burkholderia pseudomallei Pakistan 9]EEP84854.1 conserved hypothetical protein [Burkholderia mallei GB8 horse 4]EES42926.1 conserved hypothetical protein 
MDRSAPAQRRRPMRVSAAPFAIPGCAPSRPACSISTQDFASP